MEMYRIRCSDSHMAMNRIVPTSVENPNWTMRLRSGDFAQIDFACDHRRRTAAQAPSVTTVDSMSVPQQSSPNRPATPRPSKSRLHGIDCYNGEYRVAGRFRRFVCVSVTSWDPAMTLLRCKVVVVGDARVGKSALTQNFHSSVYPKNYVMVGARTFGSRWRQVLTRGVDSGCRLLSQGGADCGIGEHGRVVRIRYERRGNVRRHPTTMRS